MDLKKYQAVLLDLDGTIFHDDHALPGAIELLGRLSRSGQKFACLSNSTTSAQRIVQRLIRMGVELKPEQIYTAAGAAADYVLARFHEVRPAPRVYNLATEGVQEILEGLVQWVRDDREACDAIIVGAPSNVYAIEERQRTALLLARKGAIVVGICADRVYPSPRGLEFGSGALCAFLGYAADVTPVFCGKPQKIFFDELCRRIDADPRSCVLVGDNLESDVSGAKTVGMPTILTLTGVASRQDLVGVAADRQPDFVINDLRELL